MNYEDFKRDLAVRILRRLGYKADTNLHESVDVVMKALDDFLPDDDSVNRGHTEMVDLACVYKVDKCPDCGAKGVEYSYTYEFCNECGYTFN
jgi:hypothetical protein